MGTITIQLPKPSTLTALINTLERNPTNWVGEQLMPTVQTDKAIIEYTIMEAAAGMTAPHNIGSDPKIDKRRGGKQMRYAPGYFKESDLFGEEELLKLSQYGGTALDLRNVMTETLRERYMKTRLREEWLRWQILQGRLYYNENGVYVNETFGIQRYVPVIGFDNAQATVVKDFATAIRAFKGTGASGVGATAYLNSETFAEISKNRNADDLFGLRDTNDTRLDLDNIEAINRRLKEKGLIQLKINDDEYTDADGVAHYLVRTGNIVIIANSPTQEKVGTFWETASLHKLRDGRPFGGYFALTTVNGVPNTSETVQVTLSQIGAGKNPQVELTGGVYGGPELRFANRVMLFEAFDNNQND